MELKITDYICTVCEPSTGLKIDSKSIERLSDIEKSLIDKKIKKIRNSAQMSKGILLKESIQDSLIDDYLHKRISFHHFVQEITMQICDKKKAAGKFEGFDVLVLDGTVEGCHFLAIMDCAWQKGYTHYTETDGIESFNRIVEYKNMLSEGILKEDNIFFYDILNETVLLKEVSFEIEGKKQKLFSDLLFPCGSVPSEKETLKIMKEVAGKLAEKYELKKTEVLPKLKAAINETEELDIVELADTIFEEKKMIRDDFVASVQESGINTKIPFDSQKLEKKDRMVRFVTETGIEISIPAQYIKRKDFVEIVNHSNGTVSIEIKNISDLKNGRV